MLTNEYRPRKIGEFSQKPKMYKTLTALSNFNLQLYRCN